jgi:O-acetylhomoserine (thiol)-lyase
LRNQGPTLALDAAWQFIHGVETLSLRMARHSENALSVAKLLKNYLRIPWVRYPGLVEDPSPSYSLARKYLPTARAAWLFSESVAVKRQR